jgi:NADH-quinone oxidoreductase subunit N
LLIGTGFVLVGIAFKMGVVPAHSWMPDVAEGAPVPAAAFLTVVPKIGAAIALARLISLFPPEAFNVRPLIATLAVATMTLGNLAALWQDDIRRLIGWSSVSQSGYALMAICVVGLSASALPALLFFLLGYTVANLAAFAAIAHLRGRTERIDYHGIATGRPGAALALIIGFLSLVGIPPLAGFVGKLVLFLATIDGGYAWLAAVAVANTVVSLFYYLRFIGPMYFTAPAGPAAVLGPWTAIATAIGMVMVVAFGIIAGTIFDAFGRAQLLP